MGHNLFISIDLHLFQVVSHHSAIIEKCEAMAAYE